MSAGGRRPRLADDVVARVRQLLEDGATQKEASDATGVSQTQVGRIRRKHRIRGCKAIRTTADEIELRRALGAWMIGKAEGREVTIAQGLMDGLSNSMIGRSIGISSKTVAYAVHRRMVQFDDEGSMPKPHVTIGPASAIDPDAIAGRLMHAIDDLGAVQLICYRGTIAAAVPGSRMSRLAEKSRQCALVGTYTPGADRHAIADDIREAIR